METKITFEMINTGSNQVSVIFLCHPGYENKAVPDAISEELMRSYSIDELVATNVQLDDQRIVVNSNKGLWYLRISVKAAYIGNPPWMLELGGNITRLTDKYNLEYGSSN